MSFMERRESACAFGRKNRAGGFPGAVERLENRRLLSGTFKTLASFSGGQEFYQPGGGLVMDSAGNLYGTTYSGGADTDGTIYEIPKGSTTPKVLYTFTGGSDGANPQASLVVDSAGNLYGTTSDNNNFFMPSGYGSIFELPKGSTTLKTLYNFQNAADGSNPTTPLLRDSAGDLFGNTEQAVFELPAGKSSLKIYTHPTGSNEGLGFQGGIVMDSAGDIFGTTFGGGTKGSGTIFEIPKGSSTVTTIYNFVDAANENNANPVGSPIIDGSGNLYGVTGEGDGEIFELPKGSATDKILFTFDGTDGENPTGLLMDANGNLFGTTNGTTSGSGAALGTVFELQKGSSSIQTLYTFTDKSDGEHPDAPLIMDSSGNLYGSTGGDPGKSGTAFEMSGYVPAKLAFAKEPASASAGKNLPAAVTVDVEDAAGQIVTTDDSTVTLSIASSSASGAVLVGTVSVKAVNGVATFSSLLIADAGTYTLKSADGALTAAVSTSFTLSGGPYSGTPAAFGLIQAENFDLGGQNVGYYDPGNVNKGGAYRPYEGVGIGDAPSSEGGGYFVGWTVAGEWLDYTVNVAATGTYTLNFRVASAVGGGTFHMDVDGTNVTGMLTVANTGSWNTYKTISKTGVHLTAGKHVLRLQIDSTGSAGAAGNFDWLQAVET